MRADRDDGTSLGVKGTPTFFINGVKFTGQPTYQALKASGHRTVRLAPATI